jgi:hypothetical protein
METLHNLKLYGHLDMKAGRSHFATVVSKMATERVFTLPVIMPPVFYRRDV